MTLPIESFNFIYNWIESKAEELTLDDSIAKPLTTRLTHPGATARIVDGIVKEITKADLAPYDGSEGFILIEIFDANGQQIVKHKFILVEDCGGHESDQTFRGYVVGGYIN